MAAPDVPGKAREGELHKGRVEHSQKVPALPPTMRSGATLSDDAFDTSTQTTAVQPTWFAMPAWLSGTWSRPDAARLVFEEDLVTGKRTEGTHTAQFLGNEVCGYQMDPAGTIWHCLLFPYKRVIVNDNGARTLAIVTSAEVVAADTNHLVIKRMSIRLSADRLSAITKALRTEEYTEYLPVGPDEVRNESSLQYFDQSGKPVLLQKTTDRLSRISNFQKSDFWPHDKAVDLRPLFDKFLYSSRSGAPKILKYDSSSAPASVPNNNSDFEN